MVIGFILINKIMKYKNKQERRNNMETYSIRIFDEKNKLIGELLTATPNDIIKFIDKGFKVIDIITHKEIMRESVTQVIGVSECVM